MTDDTRKRQIAGDGGADLSRAPQSSSAEVADFAAQVKGDDVTFVAVRWADLLADWTQFPTIAPHAAAITARFGAL